MISTELYPLPSTAVYIAKCTQLYFGTKFSTHAANGYKIWNKVYQCYNVLLLNLVLVQLYTCGKLY